MLFLIDTRTILLRVQLEIGDLEAEDQYVVSFKIWMFLFQKNGSNLYKVQRITPILPLSYLLNLCPRMYMEKEKVLQQVVSVILTKLHQPWNATLTPLSQIMKTLTPELFYMQKRHQIWDMMTCHML